MSQLSSEPNSQPGEPITVPSGVARAPDAMALAAGTETILFVEDEAFVREVTGEVLRAAGYVVLMATSAAEALRNYAEHSDEVGILLTDVILPGDSGRDLAKQLRRENVRLKVLLVTGYGKEIGLKGKEYPVEKCLSKPFSARMPLRRVREALDEPDFKPGNAVPDHALRR